MKILMLRGQVPQDRNPKEIMFNSLREEDDVWTHLAMAMGDQVHVLYWGGERVVKYGTNKYVVWTEDVGDYIPSFAPDVIFARGGFTEYHDILRRFPQSFKIFYGAGKRHLPLKGFTDYHLTLQDSGHQLAGARHKFPDINHKMWIKPVPPQFHPRNVKKEYDICYIANGGQADIKRIKWVYKTAPKDLKILHLGLPSKYKPPKNVTCKRVLKNEMPKWISKCKAGIVPYKSVDSAPRALYEMLACNLPVTVCDEVNFYLPCEMPWITQTKKHLWEAARLMLDNLKNWKHPKGHLSVHRAAKNILTAIKETT